MSRPPKDKLNEKQLEERRSFLKTAGSAAATFGLVKTNGSSVNDYSQIGTSNATKTFKRKIQESVNVKDFGAAGDGTTDDTAAIQAAINSITAGTVIFPAGTYRTTANITLKSNVNIIGYGAKLTYITSWANLGSFFSTSGAIKNNISISGITFQGNGTWKATPFANPYGGGNSVGFTNNHVGIFADTNSYNIRINNCIFTGLGVGVVLGHCNQCDISNNTFTTIGKIAIYPNYCSYITINSNIIREVLGNLNSAGDTIVANSKFADGISIFASTQVTVSNNVIENCIRIGVVLEGDAVTLNSGIAITGNAIKNLNSCRGTEYNAAIWSENTKSDYTCLVTGNTLNNTGANAGANYSIGIQGSYLTMTGNFIRGFGIGITGIELRAYSNTIENNGLGISIASQIAGKSTEIVGNRIALNINIGFEIYQCHGVISVRNNTFEDNASAQTRSSSNCSALRINRYYNDQKVPIVGNTFISSQNSRATSGQLYAITGVAGGDFNFNTYYIQGNTFLFTGTVTAYPKGSGVVPVAFAYDNTWTMFPFDMLEIGGNFSTKIATAYQSSLLDTITGSHRFVGWVSAAPSSGSYRQGDYVQNSNPVASGNMGWICTVGGTPGIWKSYGAIAA